MKNKIIIKKGQKFQINKEIYLPLEIINDLDTALTNNPPNFSFKKAFAYFLLNLIAVRNNANKDYTDYNESYVPLYSKILESYYYGYKKYIKYLCDNNILEKRNYSTSKATSNSFRFKNPVKYHNQLCYEKIELEDLSKFKNIQIVHSFDGKIQKCSHLVKWFYEGLEINCEGVYNDYCKEKNYNKKLFAVLHSQKIKNKEFWFTRNFESDRRLHSPITNLPKKIRKHLRFKGDKLESVDIKCSQPFFLIYFIEEVYKEIVEERKKNYTIMFENILQIEKIIFSKDFVSEYSQLKNAILHDDLYSFLGEKLYPDTIIELKRNEFIGCRQNKYRTIVSYNNPRELMKKTILRFLYVNTNNNRYLTEDEIDFRLIESNFPYFSLLLKVFKKNDHKRLSKILQNIESHCILDYVTKELSLQYPEMPLFTIHDSVITTESWNKKVNLKLQMERLIYNYTGLKPQLVTEQF